MYIFKRYIIKYKTYSPKSTSFTLIELLVVVAIMGLLAVMGIIAFNHVQAKARDAKREADLEAIATAMELSMTTVRSYPDTSSSTYCLETECDGVSEPSWCTDIRTYMPDIPSDPLNGSSNDQCYLFSSDGSNYRVATQLEKNDSRMSSDSGIYLYFMERASDFTAITLSDWTDAWQGDLGGFVSYLDDYLVGRWSLSEDDQVREGVWFDGGDDWIDCGNGVKDYLSYGDDYTVSLWFKADVTSSDDILFNSIVTDGADEMAISIATNVLRLGHYNGAWHNISVDFTDTSNWHHLIMINSSGTISGYLDDTEMSGTTNPRTGSAVGTVIGTRTQGGYFFDGQISDVRVYNRALTGTEVENLYNGTDVSSGLTNHWLFDDETGIIATDSAGSSNGTLTGGPIWSKDISDLSSNSNNGTVYGAVYAEGQDASVNGSLDFDGTDDYIDCGTDSILNLTTQFTYSFWIKRTWATGTPSHSYHIATKSDNGFGGSVNMRVGVFDLNDRLRLQVSDGSTWPALTSTTLVSYADQWIHGATTFDNGVMKIYINGSLNASSTASFTELVGSSHEFVIGAFKYSGTFYQSFDGYLSDIRAYNRALTDDEIMSIYMGTD